MKPLLLAALALSLAATASAQHDHATHPATDDPMAVSETFVVDGLRLDPADPPPGSGVGRAGLRFGDGGYVSVVHGRPYVRGRQVWGGLVALNAVWVAGAHRATEMVTTVPLEIGGVRVEPGAYSLFVTPRHNAWTLHVNRALGMHLADEYDADLDVTRVSVMTESLSERSADPSRLPVEGLTWRFADDGSALTLAWERLSAAFPISRAR